MTKRAPLLPGIRLLRILWRMMPAVFVSANIVAWPWLLDASDNIKQQALVIGIGIVGFRLVGALVSEVLSPHRPGMRMIPMSDVRANRMATVIRAIIYVLLGAQIAIYLVHANGWNESIAATVALVRRLGLILFGAMAIARIGLLAKIDVETVEGYPGLVRRLFVRIVFPLTVLTLMFVSVVSALGYRAIAEYVWTSFVGTNVAFLVTALGARFLRNRLHRAIAFIEVKGSSVAAEGESAEAANAPTTEAESAAEEPLDEDEHEDTEPELVAPPPEPETDPTWIGVEKIVSGIIRLAAWAVVIWWTLSVWGVEQEHINSFFDLRLFSEWGPRWGHLAAATTVVFCAVLFGRLVSTVLTFIVFPRANVDAGARYAILAILRYVVYFVAGYMAFSALGFDTGALTVFAGAFGVALAFGLQDIFGNFLSGLIMLVERPVRVGDLIEVGTTSGRVEAIKLRGTTIRTFENTTIIIPNSQMLGERLKNLSHDMKFARIQVDVGVSYDSDPRKVERVLLRTALRDRRVLREPAPFVRFTAFGDSALLFLLRCYTGDPGARWAVASDMNTAVFEALKREGITIPFPQRDLHIVSGLPSVTVDRAPDEEAAHP